MPKIALVDDDRNILTSVSLTLEAEGYIVSTYTDGASGLEGLTNDRPDLAILDVGVPDGNGFDVCRAIRKTSELPIVFLTARNEEIDRILGLELGADDYVSKPFSPREVCARVRAILRRSAARPASPATEAAPLQLDETAQRIRCGGQLLTLTRYEYLLLATLLKRPQRIFSRAELMDLVWGDAPDTADRTVDAHIKLVRAKLREAGASAELIQTHRHMGYSLSA